MVKNLKRLRKQIEREHGKTAATKYPGSQLDKVNMTFSPLPNAHNVIGALTAQDYFRDPAFRQFNGLSSQCVI